MFSGQVERGLQGRGMSRETSSLLFWTLGFLCLGGGFGVAAVKVMQPVPPPPFAPVEAVEAEQDEGLMQVYVPLEEQIAVAVAEQPVRVMLTIGFSLRASVEELISLKAEVDAKRPALLAAMLEAAQVEVVKSVDPAVLLKTLPEPLRAVVNEALATAALPEPVEEVLIVGLVTQ